MTDRPITSVDARAILESLVVAGYVARADLGSFTIYWIGPASSSSADRSATDGPASIRGASGVLVAANGVPYVDRLTVDADQFDEGRNVD